jgi:glycosyltransferase involved in cell wall biosynthesis
MTEFFVYYPQNFFADQLSELGIKIHYYRKKYRYSPKTISSLYNLVNNNGYDFVISFLNTPNFYSEVVQLLTYGKKSKLIVSERLGDAVSAKFSRQNALRQLHRFADYIIVNSHHQRLDLEQSHAWIKPKIGTIYNGVDLNTFHPTSSKSHKNEQLKLLTISGVTSRKNGLRLIQALEILRREHHIFPLVHWVGEHQMHIPERRDTSLLWKSELKRLHLENQWQWLEPRHDIPRLMNSYDALIHPSYLEGLPNAVCEALASGLPVLVSNSLDHPRLVQDGISGYLFDPFAPESIAQAILRFSKLDDAARQKMSESARSFAENELALDRFIDEYEQLFKRLR